MKRNQIQPGQIVKSRIKGGVFGSGDLFEISHFLDGIYPPEFVCCRPLLEAPAFKELYFRPEELDPAEDGSIE